MTDLNVYLSKERFVNGLNDLLNESGNFEGTILYYMCPVDGEYIHIVEWNIWINVECCGEVAIMKEISREMMMTAACGRVEDPEHIRYLMKKTDWAI